MNFQEWLEKAKKLANNYAHCYAFVGKWYSAEQILDEWDFSDYEEEDDDEDLAKRLEGWYEVAIECNDENSCWKIKPTHFMFKPLPSTGEKS